MMNSDAELLKRYVEEDSNEAFEELITRHAGLVYSAALRQVRSHELAQEVAQAVFMILAQKARRLAKSVILSGWLYRTTWFTATKAIRREQRRQLLEQESIPMNAPDTHEEAAWKQIEPHLDAAMKKLGDTDRTALVLRYFENKNLREVGSALGTSEDAAQKRVSRALEKLRGHFSKKALPISAASLASELSANAITAPSAGTALQIALAVTSKGATAAITTLTLVQGTITMMTYANLKTAIPLTVAALVIAGTPIALQQKKIATLESETESLRTEILQLENQEPQFVTDPNLLAEIEQLREDTLELQRLRGEVAGLRRDKQELAVGINTAVDDEVSESDDENSSDPQIRMRLGQELVKEGKYVEALEHYLWAYDEGATFKPAFAGVRSSFLLGHIADLGKIYPPAREALIQRRDEREAKLLAGSNDRMLPIEVASMNKYLDEAGRTIELLDRLPETDPNRGAFVEVAYEELLSAKRYEDIFAAITPEAVFEKRVQAFEYLQNNPRFSDNELLLSRSFDGLVGEGGKALETLAGVGETDRAIAFINRVLEIDSSIETIEDLKRNVRRTENAEVLQYLENR